MSELYCFPTYAHELNPINELHQNLIVVTKPELARFARDSKNKKVGLIQMVWLAHAGGNSGRSGEMVLISTALDHAGYPLLFHLCRVRVVPDGLSIYGYQHQVEIMDLGEDAKQCGLISQSASQNCPVTPITPDGESIEPIRPAVVELSLNSNLVCE